MAKRARNPFLTTFKAFTRSALSLQRAAAKNPLARAAERAARKATKQVTQQATRQVSKQIRQATEQLREISGQALQVTRKAGERQTERATRATRQVMTGVQTPVAALPTVAGGTWTEGRWGTGPLTTRRYRLFCPNGLTTTRPVPLLILLHGCGQDSACIAVSSRIATLARQQGFIALLPEQSVQANSQRCWNWFRSPTVVEHEAMLIMQIADHVARLQPVDPRRLYLAGLSAGAAMALTVALRYPQRIAAVASHSGPVPHSARNPAEAARSMHGHPKADGAVLKRLLAGQSPPPALIVQGDRDRVVDPSNAGHIAALWLSLHPQAGGATASPPQVRQRGQRHRSITTDWVTPGPGAVRSKPLYVRLAIVEGLDHAWSGGVASQAFSDPGGPDALKLAWQFFESATRKAPGAAPFARI